MERGDTGGLCTRPFKYGRPCLCISQALSRSPVQRCTFRTTTSQTMQEAPVFDPMVNRRYLSAMPSLSTPLGCSSDGLAKSVVVQPREARYQREEAIPRLADVIDQWVGRIERRRKRTGGGRE